MKKKFQKAHYQNCKCRDPWDKASDSRAEMKWSNCVNVCNFFIICTFAQLRPRRWRKGWILRLGRVRLGVRIKAATDQSRETSNVSSIITDH